MPNFANKVSLNDSFATALVLTGAKLSPDDLSRLEGYNQRWNFYKGYHWEDIEDTGKTEVTQNYCSAFVDKFVSYELGKGFSIRMKPEVEELILPFLNEVWESNHKLIVCQQLGQSKSVTGDAWIQVSFSPKFDEAGNPDPTFKDPFNEYDKGKINIDVVPPSIVFPEYEEGYSGDVLKKLTVRYAVKGKDNGIKMTLYEQIWTDESVTVNHGAHTKTYKNKYGIIPFFQCKNIGVVGEHFGKSDLEDVIPLNMELNLKSSDVSEIIDYHASPITVIFGARVGNLEKGANKTWGGLPTDAKVENLELKGDLSASRNYLADIKQAMHEVGHMPEGALGKQQAISNTSGIALHIAMMPLTDWVNQKKANTIACLTLVNKMIIKIGLVEGLIPEKLDKWMQGDTYSKDIFHNEVYLEDTLPKDRLVELQSMQYEAKMGLTARADMLRRLGRQNIEQFIKEIDQDRQEHPDIYGIEISKQTGDIVTGVVDEELGQQPSNSQATQTKNNSKRGLLARDIGANKKKDEGKINSGLTNGPKQGTPKKEF